jgi:hypothetical protein
MVPVVIIASELTVLSAGTHRDCGFAYAQSFPAPATRRKNLSFRTPNVCATGDDMPVRHNVSFCADKNPDRQSAKPRPACDAAGGVSGTLMMSYLGRMLLLYEGSN